MGRLIKKESLVQRPLSLTRGNRALFDGIWSHSERHRFIEETQSELINVAVALAQQLVGEAVAHDPRLLENRFKAVLSKSSAATEGRLRVHSFAAKNTNIAQMAKRCGFLLFVDDGLQPADCILETPLFTIDATVTSALYHFKQVVSGARSVHSDKAAML